MSIRKLHVLGILGSPRKKGNSSILLDEVLRAFDRKKILVEKVTLGNLKFRPSIECGGCDRTGICVLRDDLSPIYKKIKEADILIIASPIFFGTISALTKMFIDRMQCIWVEKYVLKRKKDVLQKKIGAFIAVGGMKTNKHFYNAKNIIKIFFTITGFNYTKDLFFGGIEKNKDLKNKNAKIKAFNLGKYLIKKISI